ncbi:hypothetical protein GIB67_003817 [Kingdonia uniflora]|uniref:Condensin-2 complex subunit H2 n=1 Tax=Kingdonia uniflora TaxID=39325 RepID=A0A7J7P2Y7_9MAGN|nr:hypothetical protein GIB67_003817 [Kingdonia uniflora]
MRNNEPGGGSSSVDRFHIVQPHRDPEANWAVDLAKNLEEYLLKICSGEVTGDEEEDHLSVNFAQAALLLQGSVQVYSRKVEYLYTLVVHALEFISQKRQQDQTEKSSTQPDLSDNQSVIEEDNEPFLDLDDVPVEPKNCLDCGLSKDDGLNNFVKPPANLVVLEGDCFDTTGESGELESYLLATHDLYRDFILLDPCDAGEIHNFLKGNKAGTSNNASPRGTSVRSKTRKSFLSPTRRSAHKSPFKETQDAVLNRTPEINCNTSNNDVFLDPLPCNLPETDYHREGDNDGYSEPMDGPDDEDDDDDPWKPLNPHEPGNLKVKPFRKVKVPKRQRINSSKQISLASQFPVARLHGTISPDLTEVWEAQLDACKRQQEPQSPPLYEKLRQSLTDQGNETLSTFNSPKDDNEDDGYDNDIPDFEQGDFAMPKDTNMDADVPPNYEKVKPLNYYLVMFLDFYAILSDSVFDGDFAHSDKNDVFGQDQNCHASLEELCRSHLDALLASIAENEKQSELASRVSTWKQRIESTLDEQDSRPPFDIHKYGERVLDKLSIEDSRSEMSFTDVVSGQEKHDVARIFSALLQLVNNGNVSLDRGESGSNSLCYSAANSFRVRLLRHNKRREEVQLRSSKKRVKSPMRKHRAQGDSDKLSIAEKITSTTPSSLVSTSSVNSPQQIGKYSVKLGKVTTRCTPEGKRRRKSRLAGPVDLQTAG